MRLIIMVILNDVVLDCYFFANDCHNVLIINKLPPILAVVL